MGKTFVVAKREYLERVRGKWFVIATVSGPLFFGAIMIVPAVLGARTGAPRDVADVAIIDATGTDVGRRLGDRLRGPAGDTTIARVVSVGAGGSGEAGRRAARAGAARGPQARCRPASAPRPVIRARDAGPNRSSASGRKELPTSLRKTARAQPTEQSRVPPAHVALNTET